MTQERLFPDVANQELTQAPPTRRATRPNEARLYRPVRNQVQMILRDLDSLLPEDHLARAIWAFVERLDLSAFYAPIKAVVGEPGHPATDPEARVMKMGDGGYRPAFNVQLASETEHQVIVGVSVTNRGTEGNEAPPMLERVIERTEQHPKEYLIDGGQATLGTVDKLSEAGVTVYAPTQAPRGSKRTQDEPRSTDSPAVAAWRVRMATEPAKATYKERAATSECVNARFRQHGLYQFVVRGLAKVTSVALWLVITHNLLRWIALTS